MVPLQAPRAGLTSARRHSSLPRGHEKLRARSPSPPPGAVRPSARDRLCGSVRLRMDRWRKLQYPGLAATLVFYIAHVLQLGGRLQDDAFISFRYARNLATGAGLVWNVGERVEGYTNFLWTLLLAIPFVSSKAAEPVLFARVLSIAGGAAAIVGSFLLVRRLAPKSALLPLVPPLLLAGNWSFAINTMSGLETVFLAGLTTMAVWLLVVEAEDLRYRGSSVLFALAALTRPEAIGLFVGMLGLVAWPLPHPYRPEARRYLARLTGPFAAIVGLHIAFRLAYYGHFVPNTFVAKFGVPLPAGLPSRGEYLSRFLLDGLDPFVVFTALAGLFVVARLRDPAARIVSAAGVFGFVNVAVSGADFMIGFRYLVPYLPVMYVAAALGGGWVVERFSAAPKGVKRERESPKGFWVEGALLVLAVAEAGRGYAHSRDRLHAFEELRLRVSIDTGDALGRWLGEHLPAGTRVATVDIGAIGFASNLPVLDLSGLTDPAIARLPGDILDRRLDLDALFQRDIGAFVLVSRAPGPPGARGPVSAYWPPGSSRALLSDPRMREGYAFTARYPSYVRLERLADGSWRPLGGGARAAEERDNSYFLELYLRRDIAAGLAGDPPGQVP